MALAFIQSEWHKLTKDVGVASFHPALWFTPDTLPVVGLDVIGVQDTLFALRAADQEHGIADAWLRAVQCAQLAHDRLLSDLRDVDRNLGFWQAQVTGGGAWSHGAFMLLARGPAVFAADVAAAAARLRRLLGQAVPALAPPPGTDAGAAPAAPAVPASGGAGGRLPLLLQQLRGGGVLAAWRGKGADEGSATDMMQHRVLLLRALRSRLAVALAQLTEAAGHLRLDAHRAQPASGPAGRSPASWAAAGSGGASRQQQQREHLQALEAEVRRAVHGMRAALEALLAPQQQPDAARVAEAAEDQAAGQGGGASAAAAGPPSLASELAALLDLLALRPLAGTALGLHRPPQHHDAGQEAAERPAAGVSAAAETASAPAAALQLTAGGASARTALDAARRAAALSGPLLPLPPSVRMPSSFQRHWLRYAAAAAVAGYGALFLLRHSRLAGSDDLDRWVSTALSSVRSAVADHVVAPLAAVRDELFRTFRDRPAIVSAEEFAAARESLVRMLDDFAADQGRARRAAAAAASAASAAAPAAPSQGASSPTGGAASGADSAASGGASAGAAAAGGDAAQAAGVASSGDSSGAGDSSSSGAAAGTGSEAAAEAAVAAGMAVLMGCYEEELRTPLRNLLLGDLARALLIQVHHVKVDGQAAMLRLDQLLRANELTAALVAALPALGLSLAVGAGVVRLLSPRAPDPRREAVPSRLAMAALELALVQLARREVEAEAGPAQGHEAKAGEAEAAELRGLALYRLYRVYVEVSSLYTPAARRSRTSEWRPLAADLVRLAAPAPAAERLAEHQRIMRTYSVFQR